MEGMHAPEVIRTPEKAPAPFDTRMFGFESANPVIKALDWRAKYRGDVHILTSMRSYVEHGVRSRRERYGEFMGRALSGYWREPQHEIHVHVPGEILPEAERSPDARENWRKLFASSGISKGSYTHRAYAVFDAPIERDYQDRYSMVSDATPLEERRVKAFFVRSELFEKEALDRMRELATNRAVPIIDIATLTLI